MLDVPIYGRIATLELFRPHVSIAINFFSLNLHIYFVIDFFFLPALILVVLNRVRHRIFYLLQQKDTNSVFFNGMPRHLSLLQGLSFNALFS